MTPSSRITGNGKRLRARERLKDRKRWSEYSNLPRWNEAPGPRGLPFQQRPSRSEWFGREAAYVDLDPIDVNLNNDHICVGEAGRKMRIQVARPHGPHF